MTCGEKIQKLRKGHGYTQEDLADILNVSRQSVSRWESDIAFPETDKLITLAKLFKCSIDYLLNPENDENKEVKEKSSFDIKRFLLPNISILLGLLSIGLFFIKSFSFETGTLYFKTKSLFNLYDIAFFLLDGTSYSPFINIMALFAFISIICSILISIFVMVFKIKGLGITLNILNILTPFFLLLSLILIRGNVKATPWIIAILYVSLVICSSYIKKLDYIECKKLMLPVLSILCVLMSLIYEMVLGSIHEGLSYSYNEKGFAVVYLIFHIASLILAIVSIIKNLEIINKVLSISNVVLLFLSLLYLNEIPSYVFLLLFVIQMVNFGRKNLLGKYSLIMLLFALSALTYTDMYCLNLDGATDGYSYWGITNFYSLALFRIDGLSVSFVQVVAFIVALLLAITFVTSIIHIYFNSKICSSILSVVNMVTPLLFTITLIICGNITATEFCVICLGLFYLPYIALIVGQFSIKDLRSPLVDTLVR